MLNVVVQETDKARIVQLSGVLDDAVDLEKLIGAPPRVLLVGCGGVTRVNSIGVKSWVTYFSKAESKRTQLVFFNCSPAIIEQFNQIVNFGGGGKVKSLQVPFSCEKCSHQFVESFATDSVIKAGYDVGERECPKCKGVSTLDDLPEQYFNFLMR